MRKTCSRSSGTQATLRRGGFEHADLPGIKPSAKKVSAICCCSARIALADRARAVGRAPDRDIDDRLRDAPDRGQLGRVAVLVRHGPLVDAVDLLSRRPARRHSWRRSRATRSSRRDCRPRPWRPPARARRRLLGGSEERIPDDPRIDRAFLERGARIGRRQEDQVQVATSQPLLLEQLDDEVMDVLSLVERDLPALRSATDLIAEPLGTSTASVSRPLPVAAT